MCKFVWANLCIGGPFVGRVVVEVDVLTVRAMEGQVHPALRCCVVGGGSKRIHIIVEMIIC